MLVILGKERRVKFPALKTMYLKAYRFVGFWVITGGLAYMFGYGACMLFFMANNTWVAPFVLSATSDKMLQFSAGYQQLYQNVETLKVAVSQAQRDLSYAKDSVRMYQLLADDMERYTRATDKLSGQKTEDLKSSYILGQGLTVVADQAKISFKAGLLTKTDTIQLLTAIQQFNNTVTDGSMALNTTKITLSSQIVQLNELLAQAQNDVHTKQETLNAANKSLVVANDEMSNLSATAYYAAHITKGTNLAFIAYDNRKVAKVGNPVYDCYLMIVACHQVGVIKHIYKDEQIIDFPLFNIKLSRTVRGFFVDLDMSHPEYMDSTLFFVGKPLWF